jgi:hypothetical protein
MNDEQRFSKRKMVQSFYSSRLEEWLFVSLCGVSIMSDYSDRVWFLEMMQLMTLMMMMVLMT